MQYMIIDVDTDEMIDVIDIASYTEKEEYENTHLDHYLEEEVDLGINLEEDFEIDFEDEDD